MVMCAWLLGRPVATGWLDTQQISNISVSDKSVLDNLLANEIVEQKKTFYIEPCDVALDNFMIIFAVLAIGVGFSAPLQFLM